MLLHPVGGGQVDDRTHERLRIGEGLVDDHPVDELVYGVEQRAFLAVLDDQPASGRAALAGGQKSGLDDDDCRGLDVLGVPHHERVIAAELESEDLVRSFRELAMERLARARGAGEQEPVDPGLRGKRLALFGAADQQPDHPVGDLRFVQAANEELARRRGLLGRLEHHRIAGDQGRDDVPIGKVRGEIIGAEHRQNAVRLVANGDLVA